MERLAAFASVGGILLTGLYTFVGVFKQNWSIESDVAVVSMAIISVMLGILALAEVRRYNRLARDGVETKYLIKKLEGDLIASNKNVENLQDKINIICKVSHNICHEIRNRINNTFEIVLKKYKDGNIDSNDLAELNKVFNMFCIYFLDNVKSIFDVATGDNCAACIKIITPSESDRAILVKTFMRDATSYRSRRLADLNCPEYPYEANTAFRKILSPHTDDVYFISNDLNNEAGYENLNENRKNLYNATIVVPIRIHLENKKYIYIGFICLDNMKGGFEEKRDAEILQSFADPLFVLFGIFNEVQS